MSTYYISRESKKARRKPKKRLGEQEFWTCIALLAIVAVVLLRMSYKYFIG